MQKSKVQLKSNKYQIDQSGKIEQTEKITALAAANGNTQAVILPGKEKRRLQEWFRMVGLLNLFIDTVFSVMLYLLIRKLVKLSTNFTVDIEYPGRTKIIEDMVTRLIPNITIQWRLIGKTSKAHDLAYKAYRQKIKAKKFTAEEIWKLAQKASSELAKLKAGGRLNAGLSPANRHSAPAFITKEYHKRVKRSNKRKRLEVTV